MAVEVARQTRVVKADGLQLTWKRIHRHWQLYLVIAVPLAFLITFNYVPMLGAQIAFRDYNPIQGMWHSPWTGFSEFSDFFKSPYFWPLIRNTLTLGIYTLVISTPAAVILALALNEVRNERFKRIVQMFTYAPYFISTVVLVGIMQIILSPSTGLLGQLAHLFGANPPNVLGNPTAFPSVYVWSGIWQETGYGAVIYLAALSNVNPELYEAARIDGASRFQKMLHIDVQSIKPTMIILVILAVGNVLRVGFEKVYLLQNNLNLSTSEIISTYVYKMGLLNANFSFAGAVGLFDAIVGLILIFAVNLIARRVSDTSLF
ncbi:ABC transporter permease subunit [Alicyclobacillus fastidiosus]|uniref:ABC transporter permease subunit n=1 Tax=Alicyclobacillus fastidiosus TaxID=392011 RepID=A0ABY6ZAR8_9BACL|nr:ABC transporter permease subunit [Alicyclobacillus fastidiosus]WAH39835.1 ABC transporter permease subunit [Alicyclobacillus fastidiosus]GMA61091.1 sugar ABC transporter permease [Alicyclobacillus fastidiosus]